MTTLQEYQIKMAPSYFMNVLILVQWNIMCYIISSIFCLTSFSLLEFVLLSTRVATKYAFQQAKRSIKIQEHFVSSMKKVLNCWVISIT